MNAKNKIDVVAKLSAEMKKVVEVQLASAPAEPAETNEQMRQNYEIERKFWNEGGPVMHDSKDVWVEFEGSRVRTRIYYPNLQSEYKTIFFIHGGGWVVGSIDTHDRIMRILADLSGCAVIGIDYTLAPDKKYPFQIRECDAAIDHFLANSKEYKISPEFIAYAGDSAGANMCMGTYLYRRDSGKDSGSVKAMALFYGLYGLKDSASRSLYGNEIDWLRPEDMEYYFREYLQSSEDEEKPYVNILNADLTWGVPPCFIGACEFDPLKDDSVALYEILKERSDSKFKEYKGVMHAFLHYSKMMEAAGGALEDGAKFISSKFKIS